MTEIIDSQTLQEETPTAGVFAPPSINEELILNGLSYTHHSPIPPLLVDEGTIECVLGVDEAGRGPVIGPMVYSVFYLPIDQHKSLLATTHRFDDSKVLSPTIRSSLMEKICTPGTDLHDRCGWATRVMSARDIGANMLKPAGIYNLNAQAMDATVALLQEVLAKKIRVKEIYVDTIGKASIYQSKLEKIFPTAKVTVAEKADSLYPCVSAASVCAKVTRDAAVETSYKSYLDIAEESISSAEGWGSGYPSDARCKTWMRQNMDPYFGWGTECRFSWGTAKDMLEARGAGGIKVDWPDSADDGQNMKMTDWMVTSSQEEGASELTSWFGRPVPATAF
ncbi:hypothetical protein MMC25_000992 [Agyrium rufum]|nr:hypothetical protein [Agyrium rufum]